MDLYVIRHADAVPIGERGITTDEERCLSETGEAQCRTVAEGLQRRGVALEVIVTSPLVRARQTAEGIVANWPSPAPEIQVCEELAPGGSKKRLARFVRQLGRERIAVVGHQPDLGEYAGWLIGSKRAQVELAKAGVALLQFSGGPRKRAGILLWLVTPEWLA